MLLIILPLVLLFAIYKLARLGPPWLRRPLSVMLLEVLAVGLFVAYFWWSSFPDPRFALDNLQGLTPTQVIGRLGPPDVDPRLPKWGSWTPENANGEPMIFFYYGAFFGGRYNWQGFSYGIVFNNDHVVDVKIGHK